MLDLTRYLDHAARGFRWPQSLDAPLLEEVQRLRAALAEAEALQDELTAVSATAVSAWSAYQEPLPFAFETAMSDLDVCLGDQDRARCWPPAPPAEPFFTWVVSPREAALFGETRPAVAKRCWERSEKDEHA